MPYLNKNVNVRYSVIDEKNQVSANISKSYMEIYQKKVTLDAGTADDSFISLISFDSTGIKDDTFRKGVLVVVRNSGSAAMEVDVQIKNWTAGTPDVATATVSYLRFFIPPEEALILPNSRIFAYSDATPSSNGATLDNVVPTAAGYTDSTINIRGLLNDTATEFSVEDGDNDGNGKVEDNFFIGDYIRIENEVLRVTSVSTNDSGLIGIERGMLGSVAAPHSDHIAVSWYYLNNFEDWDKEAIVATTFGGRFSATNFFGYGRTYTGGGAPADVCLNGLVPGSVSVKFSEAGYQELGVGGITPNTESGLTTGTTYQFNITLNGGTATPISFTVDGNNSRFGGSQGILQKIQEQFNALFYLASSNLFQRRVKVQVLNGDVRFTSGLHLTTSAVLLEDSSGSDTDIWGVGRFPAVGDIADPVAARFPDDTFVDEDGIERKNNATFLLDRGDGTLKRMAGGQGKINYETGAISMTNVPPRANFVISAKYSSALGGGPRTGGSATGTNQITEILARCTSTKAETYAEIFVYG